MSAFDKYVKEVEKVVEQCVSLYEKAHGIDFSMGVNSFEDVVKIMRWLKEQHPEVLQNLQGLFLRLRFERFQEIQKQKDVYVR